MSDNFRFLAKLSRFDVEICDRTGEHLSLRGSFNMEGSSIGLGCLVDTAFILSMLKAVGVDSVRCLEGQSCWITLAEWNGPVIKIEPLHKSDGEPFDIQAWQKKLGAVK